MQYTVLQARSSHLKNYIVLTTAVLGSLFCLPAQMESQEKTEKGFRTIFNGKNLDGWEGLKGAWEVSEGAIRCTGQKEGKKNWLIWRGGQPGDFELRLEFRFTSGNSGVQIRSRELEKENKAAKGARFQVRGYQAEIAAAEKMGLWHHSLAPEKYRSHLTTAGQKGRITAKGEKTAETVAQAEEIQKHCQDGKWNQLVIIASGPKLTQIINGVVFSELVDEDGKHATAKGLIALQDHGKGTVAEFRNIRIKEK
jgi:hypothetical protein